MGITRKAGTPKAKPATARRAVRTGYGSPTNASEAVDASELRPGATPDELLDLAVQYTFPASDPISVETAYASRSSSSGRTSSTPS